MSYYGWMVHANCLNLMKQYIDDDIYQIVQLSCNRLMINNPLDNKKLNYLKKENNI